MMLKILSTTMQKILTLWLHLQHLLCQLQHRFDNKHGPFQKKRQTRPNFSVDVVSHVSYNLRSRSCRQFPAQEFSSSMLSYLSKSCNIVVDHHWKFVIKYQCFINQNNRVTVQNSVLREIAALHDCMSA